jgi:hypothetical protein
MNVDCSTFTFNDWNDLITCGYDRHPELEEAIEIGESLTVLGEEWMSPAEVAEREVLRRRRLQRRCLSVEGAIEGAPASVPIPRAVVPPNDPVASTSTETRRSSR